MNSGHCLDEGVVYAREIFKTCNARGSPSPPRRFCLFVCLPCCAPLRRSRFVEVETSSLAHPTEMPPNRLVTLLQQAVAFQIDRGRYHPKASSACVPLVAFRTQNELLITRTIKKYVCTSWYLVSESPTVENIGPTVVRSAGSVNRYHRRVLGSRWGMARRCIGAGRLFPPALWPPRRPLPGNQPLLV